MKLSRVRGRKANEYLRKNGEVWRGKTMTIRWLKKAPYHPQVDPTEKTLYVGTTASTKLHKSAVKRNRMRRRCREALRVAMQAFDSFPTTQVLISPRRRSLTCPYEEIQADIQHLLAMLQGH